MAEPNSTGHTEENRNQREVTDPITHLPLLIHDHVSIELEQIPPHPAKSQDKHSPEHHEDNEKADSNERHETMERMVDEETDRGWWDQPGDVESRAKIRGAIVAAGAVAIGGPGGLFLLWTWSKIVGRSSFGWFELIFGTLGCFVMALGVGMCVLFFGSSNARPDKLTKRPDNHQHRRNVSHKVGERNEPIK